MITRQSPLSRPWRTSSYSDTAHQCIEIAQAGPACLVRDSKNRDGHHLAFSPRAWTAFTQAIRSGDLLSPADR